MTNGTTPTADEVAPPVSVTFDLSTLSYGDFRRLQALNAETTEGQAVLDTILEKVVVGGLDAIPIVEILAVMRALMARISEEMSGKNQLAAP